MIKECIGVWIFATTVMDHNLAGNIELYSTVPYWMLFSVTSTGFQHVFYSCDVTV